MRSCNSMVHLFHPNLVHSIPLDTVHTGKPVWFTHSIDTNIIMINHIIWRYTCTSATTAGVFDGNFVHYTMGIYGCMYISMLSCSLVPSGHVHLSMCLLLLLLLLILFLYINFALWYCNIIYSTVWIHLTKKSLDYEKNCILQKWRLKRE